MEQLIFFWTIRHILCSSHCTVRFLISFAAMSILVHRTGCGEKTGHKAMEIVAKVLISTETGDINGAVKALVPILVGRLKFCIRRLSCIMGRLMLLLVWTDIVFWNSLSFPLAYFWFLIFVIHLQEYVFLNSLHSNIYRGPSAFSEPETKAVRDFITTKMQDQNFLVSTMQVIGEFSTSFM